MSFIINTIQILLIFILIYFIISFLLVLIFAKLPRKPLNNYPDWGTVEEHLITTEYDKKLECWVVEPESKIPDLPAVILVHGWARNRDRMVERAKLLGEHGYTTILFSTRDHGNSDKEILGMNIIKFSQDIDQIVNWWNKPVIILGHSIGAGASIIATARNELIIGVVAEAAPYAIPGSLKHIYRPILKGFTPILLPGLSLLISLFFINHDKKEYSPKHAGEALEVPVLLIHGKKDELLPYTESVKLDKVIDNSRLWIIEHANHHNIEYSPLYGEKLINFFKSIFN